MHAILRTIQAMAFDGPRAFKLFAKFEQNHLLREIQLQQAKQQQQQQHHHQTSSTPQRHSDEIDMQPQYHNHRQQQLPILGCLLFALLAGLMAALFELDQLMNLLSIGALLMFYTLTMDIILLRWIESIQIIIGSTFLRWWNNKWIFACFSVCTQIFTEFEKDFQPIGMCSIRKWSACKWCAKTKHKSDCDSVNDLL